MKSIGDLKLIREEGVYELSDVFDAFNHNQDMDENVSKDRSRIIQPQILHPKVDTTPRLPPPSPRPFRKTMSSNTLKESSIQPIKPKTTN